MSAVFALALVLTGQGALDLGLPRPAREPRGGCPAEARVEVNLPAWRAALQQAATPERRDALLADLRLELGASEDAAAARFTLERVDDHAVQLEPGARADHVVDIVYAPARADGAPTQHLVQVLRPIDGRAFCAIGAALTGEGRGTYTVAFVPLLSAQAKAIQIERARAEARETETRRELWVARGLALHKVFDAPVGHMRSDAGGGATTATVGTLVLAGGFPRRIELTAVTKRGGCEVGAGSTPCDDGGGAPTTTTWIYDGARYVPAKEPQPKK